jgi:hypothetical protein
MSSLIPRRSAPVQVLDPDAALNRQIVRAQAPGLVAAARLQSVGLAAHVGIQQAGVLQLAVSRAFEQAPAGEHVYQAIFLAYGSVATAEIQGLGIHAGGLQ